MQNERDWIQKLSRKLPQVDLRHDTFFDPETRQILTTDMLVEGVHFTAKTMSPEDLGWKSLAVSLSDIAATGGLPQFAVVSLGLPSQTTAQWLDAFYIGLLACAKAFNCQIVGGDTVASDIRVINVALTGQMTPKSTVARRSGAKPGDIFAISGPHGLSRAGLYALENALDSYPEAIAAHARPQPRLKLAQRLAGVLNHYAMMDTSDGLADAAMRLAEASDVDVVIDPDKVMIHSQLQELAELAQNDPLEWALYGGEDFELAVCLAPEMLGMFPDLKPVGRVKAKSSTQGGRGLLKQGDELVPLEPGKAFQHFTPSSQDALKAPVELPG